jgi:anti-sigma factor RsiW
MTRLTCRELIDFLDDYVAGSLSATQRAQFDDHLGRCAACVRYLKSYQGTMRALALAFAPDAAAPREVPEELISAILAAREA